MAERIHDSDSACSDVARKLAEFVVSLRYEDLPQGVVEKAKEIKQKKMETPAKP